MRHRLARLFIFLAVCVITGCSSPVGSISDSGGNGNGNGNGNGSTTFLLLKPNRFIYRVDDVMQCRFSRPSDFKVYASDNNGLKEIDPLDSNLVIEILSTPGFLGTPVSEQVKNSYDFAIPGTYRVRGTYFGKTDEYAVDVQGIPPNPGDGTDFTDIVWL